MTAQPAPAMPANVIAALALVEAEIGGIEKRRGGDGGIQYAFRGIDAISTQVQPLFARHGVVIVPLVESYSLNEITVNGKPWTDATVAVAWSIYGPGGTGDVIQARTVGMGRDSTDKGYPKAITQAYKNLLLRLLCIGDPEDDTDGHTYERDEIDRERARPAGSKATGPKGKGGTPPLTTEQVAAQAFSALSPDDKKDVNQWAKDQGITNVMRSGERAEALLAYIGRTGVDNPTDGSPPEPAGHPEEEEEPF